MFSPEGVILARRDRTGPGTAVFPYLTAVDWGEAIDASLVETRGPLPLDIVLQQGDDAQRETTVWVFPSNWVGYEREAQAVALLAPLKASTKLFFGNGEGSRHRQIADDLRARNTSTAAYDAAMAVVTSYGRDAIGIFGAVPDDLLRLRLTTATGIFVVDRLANALTVAGNSVSNQVVAGFSTSLTALLSAADWGLQLDDVVQEGRAMAGYNQLLSWVPDHNRFFRQVGAILDAARPHVETICGPEGARAGNDPAATRAALNNIRSLVIGGHPDSSVLEQHQIDYRALGAVEFVQSPGNWHLALLLLWEWQQVHRYSRGELAANWYPPNRLVETSSADAKAETQAASAVYGDVVEQLTRLSTPLILAALVPEAD